MRDKNKCCCFTGHRAVSNIHKECLVANLPEIIKSLLSDGITDFIAGGALGFDTIAAQSVLKAKETDNNIRLILALPCKDQTKNWNKTLISIYEEIFKKADEIIYVSEEYTPECMRKRNRFMVDNSAHCVFFMTSPRGGTAYTVKYALENDLNMINAMIKKTPHKGEVI